MIGIDSLRFQYPSSDFHLDIADFQVADGEKVAVIGPSGSGKTTMLNLIAGILIPDAGDVTVNGIAVNELSDAKRRDFRITNVGFVFQDFELIDYLSVLDNILHPYRISSALVLTGQVRARAIVLAEGLGLGGKLHRNVTQLSQGEKQRAAICRALLANPKVILADEATGNLDPRNKGHILDALFEGVQAHGTSLVAVTHDHELLPRFDRVIDFQSFRAGDET
ncbi:MAG: ABC transporter ATP-binding protein [Betaproteobacteria bacterium]|nr:MAG: ABC transporter ATP-binding protein [Betaproteobacteria bacterium]